MSYTLTLSKTAVNIPDIGGDLYPEDEAASNFMFSAVLGLPFSVDVTLQLFEVTGSDESLILTPVPIVSATANTPGYTGVTFQVANSSPNNYVINVSGVPDVDFPSTYSFVLDQPDPTQPFPTLDNVSVSAPLPPNFFAVYQWSPPNAFLELLDSAYAFSAVGNNANVSVTANTSLSQYVFWDRNSSRAAFINLVNAGEA
jgi:hypothetical protein